MRSGRRVILAILLAGMVAILGSTPSKAQGFGSFALCYERLKQLVALLVAQGQQVDETVDEPREKRYIVETTFGDRHRTMSCSPKGDLIVHDD